MSVLGGLVGDVDHGLLFELINAESFFSEAVIVTETFMQDFFAQLELFVFFAPASNRIKTIDVDFFAVAITLVKYNQYK